MTSTGHEPTYTWSEMQKQIALAVKHDRQQRTWVGLTDEEIEMIVENKRAAHWEFIRQVEAKLKEKNT